MNSKTHPDHETLWRVAVGKAIEREIGDVVSHLDSCDACAKLFDSLSLESDSGIAGLIGMAKAVSIANRLKGEADTIRLEPADSYSQDACNFETPSQSILEDASRVSTLNGNEPVPNQLGDYQIVRQLGRGGMGIVYEAVHRKQGHRVALKLLPRLTGALLHRFKREFRAVTDINHPNLIGLHTLESDNGNWYFTMDLIDGTTFLDYVRPSGVFNLSRLRSALSQLVRGVMALHDAQIIHRDLKPSNVMVTRDGHVVVLDFGLVLEQDNASVTESSMNIAGTPNYMAPEQASGGLVNEASDWYAVGVMLYEAISGRLPFSGNALQILQDKQRLAAPSLSNDPTIPGDLAGLCRRLLETASHNRPSAIEITKTIAFRHESVQETVTRTETQMVGREPQLAALQRTLSAVQQHREPQTVFISGRSGEGKTTLAEQFLKPLRKDKRFAIMSGRCYDRESVPFKALDALIDSLGSYLRSLPGEDAALLIPDDINVLAQVFPSLQRVQVIAKASDNRLTGLDRQQVRQRAFRALRSLLSRICRRTQGIWFIDDLQWGDADSAEALFEVLRPPEAPAVLFLGTYRSDEVEGSTFLKKWKELQAKHDVSFADQEIRVAALTDEECAKVAIQLIGIDNEGIRRQAIEFAREANGNPFLLTELIGCFDSETEVFAPLPLHEVLERKLGRLPAEAVQLLEVVAVSGQGLALEEASITAGYELTPVATITRMCNERLVRMIGSEENPLIDTYHDRVRESILAKMDAGRCKNLHRTLAEVIEENVSSVSAPQLAALEKDESPSESNAIPRVFDLSYHYDAAGEQEKAWKFALLAAEQARRQSALEVAASNYAIAHRNATDPTNTVRYRIAEGWGETLMLQGRYEEASKRLEGAIDLVDDVERKTRLDLLQGKVAAKQGAIGSGIAFFEQGLRRLGNWMPRTRFGFGLGILKELFVQCWHSLLPGRLHRLPSTVQRDLTIHALIDRAEFDIFQNTHKFLWAHLAGMNRAELSPRSVILSRTYGAHAGVIGMLGWRSRSLRYSARSIALADEYDDLLAKGISCTYCGIGHYAAADYEQGLVRSKEAIDALEKAGDLWELHLARFHRGCCHFGLGDLAQAVADARGTFASSTRLGDARMFCSSYLWARATRGNFSFEELKTFYPSRPDDIMSTVHGIMAEGHWHRFHGRTEESLQMFERAGELIRESLCVNAHMIVALPELATALRLHAEAIEAKDPRQCERLRRRAYRLATWGARITRFFPAAYPMALRELSLNLIVKGNLSQALKVADKSCAVAESQKAKFEHAQSLLVRGRIAQQLGRAEAEEQIRTAEAAIDAMDKAAATASVS